MTRAPIRILHLEDEPDYSDLVKCWLEKEGVAVEIKLVSTAEQLAEALDSCSYDVILADYLLPGGNGLEALEVAHRRAPDTPFLLLSGTIGEQAAVEALKTGVTDYVLKQTPDRLVQSIVRAVDEAAERRERRRIEEEFARREKYFRTLTENALDVLLTMNKEGKLLWCSPSVERVLGHSPRELVGTVAFELVHPDDQANAMQRFQEGLTDPTFPLVRLDVRVRHRDGTWRYVEALGQNRSDDAELGAILVTLRDISERKRAEASLQESERRFRELFESSPDAIIVADNTGAVLDVNPAACSLHKLSRDQLTGLTVAALEPPERVQGAFGQFQQLASGRLQRVETRSLCSDGTSVPVEVRARSIGYNGRPAVLLHVRDISERLQAESALRSSEMLFHSVWENSVDGMRLSDEDGNIVAVNEAFCCLVAMRREELEGAPVTAVFTPAENSAESLETYRTDFRERHVKHQVEQKARLRNGAEVTVEETSSFVEVRGKAPLLLSLFRDVGGRKLLEDQLRQAQKMEAIGQLAGGVAHDFNNILTVIHGHASLLLSGGTLDREQDATKSAQQISRAAERAAALTRQLLAFSRRQVMQPRLLDMNEVVSNMTKMLGRILGEDIALQLSYCPHQALVNADSGMMEQVLLNLAVNSRDAMPQGGLLKIRIALREFNNGELVGRPEIQPGRFVSVSVTDTGCGIAPENLRRIFEPFFTTKEVGKGTGLGLATVYGIARQHQGWVEVQSALGKGSTFTLFLPMASQTLVRENPAPEAIVRGGNETILVVEDEGPVRDLVCTVLERHGYRTLQAGSGPEAIGIWKKNKDGIDLLLTDMVMPDHMNGSELAQKLWAERPDLKVLFSSGYSTGAISQDSKGQPRLNYLQKPYHPSRLASAVRSCLDRSN